jgi:hypothetical protein
MAPRLLRSLSRSHSEQSSGVLDVPAAPLPQQPLEGSKALTPRSAPLPATPNPTGSDEVGRLSEQAALRGLRPTCNSAGIFPRHHIFGSPWETILAAH